MSKKLLKTVDYFAPEFSKEFPITKDMQSLRKKGVLLEDVLDDLHGLYNFEYLDKTEKPIGSFAVNSDRSIGYWFCGSRSGIPSFVIGVKTEEAWKELKAKLKEKGHIR